MASPLRQSYIINDDGNNGNLNNLRWFAQSFKPAVTHTIDQVDIYIRKFNSPGILTISIQGVDGNGRPDGDEIAAGTIAEAEIGATKAWEVCVLTSTAIVTVGTTYSIVIKALSGDSTNYYIWETDTSSATYADGKVTVTINAGDSWSDVGGTQDAMFKEYGLLVRGNVLPSDKSYTKQLVAIGNNQVWYESSAGTMAELTAAANDIDCSLPLTVAEAYGKIFVANKTNLKVIDFINVKLDLGSGNELTDPPAHGDILTQDQGDGDAAYMVVDFVDTDKRYVYGHAYYGGDATAFDTSNTVSSDDTIAVMNPATFTPAVVANPPHWYDWTVYPNVVLTEGGATRTYGSMPNQATLVCNYRGRVTLSGDPELPYQWYQARQANPWDFAYLSVDAQAAVKGGSSDAGEIGDSVTALTPYKDDFLVFGCANTMWYLAGDAREGGSILELDLTTGMYGPKSWCFDGDGNFWFWGTNGLYKTAIPGKPICISEIRLPDLVKDEAVDSSIYRIVLAYDRRRVGILVTITKLSDGSNSNYWYDLRTEGFFPETYPDECGVYSAVYYEATDPAYRKLILGCSDGFIRFFDETEENDDAGASGNTAIDSYATFGPIPMASDPKLTGKLIGLNCITAGGGLSGGNQTDSDDITYDVWVANSAEEILEKLYADTNPNIAGTITAPGRRRGGDIRKKIKGVYMGIKLQNDTAAETWALEQLLIDLKQSGRLK